MKTVFMLTICCGTLFAQSADDRTVTVSVPKNVFTFGETIQMSIKYRNTGSTGWSLQKPDDSLSTKVFCSRAGDTKRGCIETTGSIKSIPLSDDIMAFSEPEMQNIVIKPGGEYAFTYEIPYTCVFPGNWILRAEEKLEKVKSESVSFQIEFTKDSPAILLNIAKNTEEKVYKRKMHTKYLRELKTDMPDVEWPYWRDSPEEKSRKETLVQKNLREFEEFRNKEKNSPDTEKAVKRINRVCHELTDAPSSFRLFCPDILEFRR